MKREFLFGIPVRESRICTVIIIMLALLSIASCGLSGRNGGPSLHGQEIGEAAAQPAQRSIPLDKVLSDIRAYQPPSDAGLDAGAPGGVFESLRAELIRQIEELAGTRGISSFPLRGDVLDRIVSEPGRDDEVGLMIGGFTVTPLPDGSNEITWTETLNGDFDGNYEVGIADLTAIALNYLTSFGGGYGNGINEESDKMLLYAQGFQTATSGNEEDSEISISDITTIALNYLYTGPAGYDLWRIPISGGTPERILNPQDGNAPTVARTEEFETGMPKKYSFVDVPPAQASSLRGAFSIFGREASAANGNYYYGVFKRKDEDKTNPPSSMKEAAKFNVSVQLAGNNQVGIGEQVTLNVEIFGNATPVSYGINWGDGATQTDLSNLMTHQFQHSYSIAGSFVPQITVKAVPAGDTVEITVLQDAPPVYVGVLGIVLTQVPINYGTYDPGAATLKFRYDVNVANRVVIYTDDAVNLKAYAFRVTYYGAGFNFTSSSYIDRLGGSGDISAMGNDYSHSPGIIERCYITPDGSLTGAADLFILDFENTPEDAGPKAMSPILSPSSAVPDLSAGSGLAWSYYNKGDLNQDGTVDFLDAIPIGVHYLAHPTDPNSAEGLADADQNGEVSVSDLTPVYMNQGSSIDSWKVYESTDPLDYPALPGDPNGAGATLAATVNFGDTTSLPYVERLKFTSAIVPSPGYYYWVRPSYAGVEGVASNLITG